jgi:hypothetical protein
MRQFRTPSAAELYALERIARRERSRALADLINSAARRAGGALAAAFTRPYAAPRAKVVQHV